MSIDRTGIYIYIYIHMCVYIERKRCVWLSQHIFRDMNIWTKYKNKVTWMDCRVGPHLSWLLTTIPVVCCTPLEALNPHVMQHRAMRRLYHMISIIPTSCIRDMPDIHIYIERERERNKEMERGITRRPLGRPTAEGTKEIHWFAMHLHDNAVCFGIFYAIHPNKQGFWCNERTKRQYGAKVEITFLGQRRKYMRRLGPQTTTATWWITTWCGAAESRPTSRDPLAFSACASVCISCIGGILYFPFGPILHCISSMVGPKINVFQLHCSNILRYVCEGQENKI